MKLLRKLMVCLFSSQIPFVRVLLIALSSREADILCSKAGGLIRFLRSKTPIYDTISVIMVTTYRFLRSKTPIYCTKSVITIAT